MVLIVVVAIDVPDIWFSGTNSMTWSRMSESISSLADDTESQPPRPWLESAAASMRPEEGPAVASSGACCGGGGGCCGATTFCMCCCCCWVGSITLGSLRFGCACSSEVGIGGIVVACGGCFASSDASILFFSHNREEFPLELT